MRSCVVRVPFDFAQGKRSPAACLYRPVGGLFVELTAWA